MVEVVGDAATVAVLALATMVPITLAALGEIVSEKAGIVNIGLEGIMLLAAWVAAASYLEAGVGYIGAYVLGAIVGLALGLIHGVLSVYLKGDQIVMGIGLNIFAVGATILGTYALWGVFSNSPSFDPMPGLIVVSGVKISPLVPATIALGIVLWAFLQKTVIGLRLRACGEDPRSAEAMGVNVLLYQVMAAGFSGLTAGLAGAYLSIDYQGVFAKNMTAGRGFIALANVAFSGWDPLLALLGGYLFGFFQALAISLNIALQEEALSSIINTIPYLATLAAVAVVARRRVRIPRWIGRPYIKE
ncbi:MAG: ABC transporter permease [Desulfurococcales archaeon]|nr:ABC transporter permease [Desulfurococcales archaeon]